MTITSQTAAVSSTEKPKSHLVSQVSLELHTRSAINLLEGQWRPGHLGLFQFIKLVHQLWQAVKEDDVYAEWYLMKIYEALEKIREYFKQHETELKAKMSEVRGFSLDLFTNPNPFKFPLNFSIPFGFMAAFAIENVDYLTRQIFTLNRLGLIDINENRSTALAYQVRDIFSIGMKWRYTGVTRQDILDNNQKAQDAEKLLKLTIAPSIFTALVQKQMKFSYLPRRDNTKPLASHA